MRLRRLFSLFAALCLVTGLSAQTLDGSETDRVTPRLKILPDDPMTAIHGASIVGSTPGYPFLFTIPATGRAPLTYSAENLPAGLSLDEKSGLITGSLATAGTTTVRLTVTGPGGTAHRSLTIVGGDHKLALTPPMGWNSWNVWGTTVDEAKVKAAADEMVSAGLQAHGYQYVNIDDAWQNKYHAPTPASAPNAPPPMRDEKGQIVSNAKFPDMKALAAYVHAKGLHIGLYSSPGPATCGGYAGSYQHEVQDAQTYANWGFDYLKYDWCSYGGVPGANANDDAHIKPYAVMRAALDQAHRDIVYSLCQYGMSNVWRWADHPDVRGNCWRTHGDINDTWSSLWDIIQSEAGHAAYAGPGHWNDPDMLMVGIVGFGHTHPTRLTGDEQITHMSLWCLLAAPLLIGCDMTRLDDFTKALLTNDEAIAIDQDPLGQEATMIRHDAKDGEVWARPLSDGTWAVGLLNGGSNEARLTAPWANIGIHGPQKVRDLWLHEDEGTFDREYTVAVPAHGTVLLKIGAGQP
jgi:alpha-galactosidase